MARHRKPKGDPINGWLVLDKPDDLTSTLAVSIVKRVFNAQKAGHAGTLDPLATGMLPIALGDATKTVPFLMEAEKVYRFDVVWGSQTTTEDEEGEVIATSDLRPDPAAVAEVLKDFIGEIDQIPPTFSAIKVDGERAYDLARAGQAVELEARKVMVHEAVVLPDSTPDRTRLEVRSGKGFYVRAMSRDIASRLGGHAHVQSLRRTRVGPFHEGVSISLEKLKEIGDKDELKALLRPVETALDDIPALAISKDHAFDLRQGRPIVLLPHQVEDWRARRRPLTVSGQDMSRAVVAMCEGKAVALGEVRAGQLRPIRVFQTV